MRKILVLAFVIILGLTFIGCESAPTWNDAEETIYNEFLALQKNVQVKMDELASKSPADYYEAKDVSDFVWDWKSYEDSSISEVYKNWRTSAGEAIETRAILYFYKDTDPNYIDVQAKRDFAEQVWLYDTKQVLDTVEGLNK